MAQSSATRSLYSLRLRTRFPPEWARFLQLWAAFNAIYGGEQDSKERARVKSCIRRHFSEREARNILSRTDIAIGRIVAIPPGDMRREQGDPDFRRKTRELVRTYNRTKNALEKLAAVGGILYQVRCNLAHGSKDPFDPRDLMLVRESVRVLEILVAELG
jgi:hypothetical protein